jgi:integrase
LIDRANKGRAEGTLSSYRVKVGHLLRLLGADTRVARLDARTIDNFVDTRLKEGASRHTIQKELVALRGTLKVGKRRGDFKADIGAVMPEGFSAGYKPRTRYLAGDEAQRLLAELTPDRAARVAFILATGARWSESDRATRADIDWRREIVHLRGTKTESSARAVPIVGASYDLLEHVERYAEGTGGLLFRPWANTRRDLNEACARAAKATLTAHIETINQPLEALSKADQRAIQDHAAFPPVSPNDLRRTYATWLRQHGTEPHLIGVALGHTDSRMAERVYGRMPVESLGRLLADRVGDCSAFVANTRATPTLERPMRRAGASKTPVNAVPRDRIELPTRGFSILGRVWPKPRKDVGMRVMTRGAAAPVQQVARLGVVWPRTTGRSQ